MKHVWNLFAAQALAGSVGSEGNRRTRLVRVELHLHSVKVDWCSPSRRVLKVTCNIFAIQDLRFIQFSCFVWYFFSDIYFKSSERDTDHPSYYFRHCPESLLHAPPMTMC